MPDRLLAPLEEWDINTQFVCEQAGDRAIKHLVEKWNWARLKKMRAPFQGSCY